MKSGKAPGPTGMTSDLMKGAGITGELTIIIVFSRIVDKGEIPKEWKNSMIDFQFIKEKKMPLSVENIEESDYWNMESNCLKRYWRRN